MTSGMILFILGAVCTLLFAVLYFTGYKKYSPMIAGINKDLYFLSDTFIVGMNVVDKFGLNRKNRSNKLMLKLGEAFTRQYIEYNYMVHMSAKISYMLLILPFAFFIGALSGEIVLTLLLIFIAVFLIIYTDMKLDTMIEEQRQEILMDLPNAISKLALLINAGMIAREAWKAVGESGDRKLYKEMQTASNNIALGYSETRAFEEFADSCRLPQIKKFVSVLCQNLKNGDEVVHSLKLLASEAWSEKKRLAKQKGDSATTKLIIPVVLMFGGVIMMVVVPILGEMSF